MAIVFPCLLVMFIYVIAMLWAAVVGWQEEAEECAVDVEIHASEIRSLWSSGESFDYGTWGPRDPLNTPTWNGRDVDETRPTEERFSLSLRNCPGPRNMSGVLGNETSSEMSEKSCSGEWKRSEQGRRWREGEREEEEDDEAIARWAERALNDETRVEEMMRGEWRGDTF